MSPKNEVLYHAIHYFLSNTDICHFKKLSTLLYIFDSSHIRHIYYSATGYRYKAFKDGPVHEKANSAIHGLCSDYKEFYNHFSIHKEVSLDDICLKPFFPFDIDVFSSFQINLLEQISKKHKNCLAEEISFPDNDPYCLTINQGEGLEIEWNLLAKELPEDLQKEFLLRLNSSFED